MPAPASVVELVKRFGEQIEAYKHGKYNETQVRVEFIDPFFKALGWDIYNEQGLAPAYKDVIHEDAIKIGIETKAPDYCFRIGGTRKFFLEAKKPAVNIKEDVGPAFQLRRYAWSSKLPLSILTDFEEFAVYDCRIRPQKNDKPSVGRVFYCRFEEYEAKWDEIAGIFSKEAVLKGSFDKYAESNKKKKGTAEVDDAFLEEIESWRETLAKNIALRNPKLSVRELNYSVQQTIDRIIFLRICEDRGIEPYGKLHGLMNGENTYKRLTELFRNADDRYNSGLFHFKAEKDRPAEPDGLTLSLKIDDEAIKDILKNLYYPDSPYEFSVLPADILGQVYEQFLGKVIRLTEGHHAKIEEKPEVRKAGGVYYTPKYIVDYIVKNTVEKLVEVKDPKQVSKLRILDPACGSGSFLIQAYQLLLDWHQVWYANHEPVDRTKGKNAALYHSPTGEYLLTIQERKRILLNNIYGVDIDSQAVEVTKLSLLLKVLEGQSPQSLTQNFELFHERALPDLQNNIKCGNSLISSDFFDDEQFGLLNDEKRNKANVFDWSTEFSGITSEGGFTTVIGNPPYGGLFTDEEKDYLFEKYPSIKGQPESYEYFIDKAIDLATKQGFIAFIVPTNFIESDRAEGLRKNILETTFIKIISSFRYNVWKDNASETLIIVLQKNIAPQETLVVLPNDISDFLNEANGTRHKQIDWAHLPKKRFLIRANIEIIRKIEFGKTILGEISDVTQGIIVYKTREDSAKNEFISDKSGDSHWKKLLDTKSQVKRYALIWGGRYLKYGDWLWCPRDEKYFKEPKLVWVRLRNKALNRKLIATFDDQGFYNRDNFNNLISKDYRYSLKYLLALFNSKLLNYWYKSYFDNVNINPAQVKMLPIRKINFDDKTDVALHDEISGYATTMLELCEKLANVKTEHERTALSRQIENLDKKIDEFVYRL
ncbi:MAG: Eco57I restriction-modification methylase domain-containing protein, partial [Rhabdochlamydiaceae bacterium]